MKKGLTLGALAAAVLLAAGCSSSGGAPENSGASQGGQSGMSQSGQTSQGNMSQSGGASRASETPTGTSHGSPMDAPPGGGIDSSNSTNPDNTM